MYFLDVMFLSEENKYGGQAIFLGINFGRKSISKGVVPTIYADISRQLMKPFFFIFFSCLIEILTAKCVGAQDTCQSVVQWYEQ